MNFRSEVTNFLTDQHLEHKKKYFKGTKSESETKKTDCDHSTLETAYEEEGTSVVPTESAFNDNGPIAIMENFEVNDDIMEDDGTQIIQSRLETASEEEVPMKPPPSGIFYSSTAEHNDMEDTDIKR